MGEPRFLRAALIVFTAALLLGVAAYAWRGWYTRYVTDDYCTAAALQTMGFAGAMQYHRDHWSGRFTYFPIKAALESIGPGTARVVPGLMLVLLAASGAWAIRKGLSAPAVVSVAAACAIAFADVDATPAVFSTYGPFAWETGAVTYMLPVVLFAVWIGVLLGGRSVVSSCIASALLLFVAGGLSETSLAAQGVMAGGVLALALLHHHRRMIWVAGTGVIATLASLAVVLSAPGNALRASTLPPRQPFGAVLRMTGELAYDFVGSHLFTDGVALLMVIVAGLSCARFVRPGIALQTALVAILCYVATFLPSAWLLSTGPPPRALQVSIFFVIVALFAASAAVRLSPQAIAVLAIVATIVPIRSAAATRRTIAEARRDAAQVEAIVRALRPQRGQHVVLRSRWALEQRFLVDDPTHWSNLCMCRYFGLQSLRVVR